MFGIHILGDVREILLCLAGQVPRVTQPGDFFVSYLSDNCKDVYVTRLLFQLSSLRAELERLGQKVAAPTAQDQTQQQ